MISKGYPDSSIVPPMIVGVTEQFSVINNFKKYSFKQSVIIGKIQPKTFKYTIETWLNRFQGDTLNDFTWGSGFHPEGIISLDINGDENTDYLNGNGRLFLGTLEGVPDTTKRYVLQNHPHIRAGSRKNTYGDVNNDGKDDIFYYHIADQSYPYLMSIITGNADVRNVKTAHITSPVLSDTTMHEVAVVLYKNKQGLWRLITYTWANFFFKNPPPGKWVNIPEKSEIRLYSVEFIQQLDSTTVTLTKLDSYQSPEWAKHADDYYKNNWSPVATNGGGTLYNSKHLDKILFYPVVSTINNTLLTTSNPVFEIQNDTFLTLEETGGCPDCLVLDHSIDGDFIEDMARGFNDALITYSITQTVNIPFVRYTYSLPKPYGTLVNDIYSLSDINGDGINDIAAMFYHGGSEPNTFVILKGKDWKTVGVNDTEHGNELLSVGNPFPIPQNTSQLQVPIHIHTMGLFELQLFTIDGKFAKTVWQQQINGAQNMTIIIQTADLPNGAYILRLTNGIQTTERSITLTK
ncbi:MAG: hypothetical protein JNJ85_05870 [Candidatus Kapabacteria bacterium]|nr:hypothetical protein [Candidatus Kapabacteria bacterium]